MNGNDLLKLDQKIQQDSLKKKCCGNLGQCPNSGKWRYATKTYVCGECCSETGSECLISERFINPIMAAVILTKRLKSIPLGDCQYYYKRDLL